LIQVPWVHIFNKDRHGSIQHDAALAVLRSNEGYRVKALDEWECFPYE
jgi:hypothetical protein